MSDPAHTVHVRIAGEEHVIRSNADPEYTRRCARLLDDRIALIRQRAGAIEPSRAAILAALSLVDELLRAENEMRELRSGLDRAAERLAERLEDTLRRTPGNVREEPPEEP